MGQPQQKRRTVLIVEDDAELRSLTAALFGDEQVETIECDSAEAALATLLIGGPEVAMIFADVRLRGVMDGHRFGARGEDALAAASCDPHFRTSARARRRTPARRRLHEQAMAAAQRAWSPPNRPWPLGRDTPALAQFAPSRCRDQLPNRAVMQSDGITLSFHREMANSSRELVGPDVSAAVTFESYPRFIKGGFEDYEGLGIKRSTAYSKHVPSVRSRLRGNKVFESFHQKRVECLELRSAWGNHFKLRAMLKLR
jgi:CheY-like chemotaxis protein